MSEMKRSMSNEKPSYYTINCYVIGTSLEEAIKEAERCARIGGHTMMIVRERDQAKWLVWPNGKLEVL